MTEETQVAAEPQEPATAQNDENQESGLKEAMIAERKKRQEEKRRADEAEYRLRMLEAQAQQKQQAPAEEDDEYTQEITQKLERKMEAKLRKQAEDRTLAKAGMTQQEIVEKLEPILKKRPMLTVAIDQSPNRIAEALQIIEDYSPKEPQSHGEKRIEENLNKSSQSSNKTDNLKQVNKFNGMSRAEFSKRRAEMLGRRPNIR
jgi:hypothetical protein